MAEPILMDLHWPFMRVAGQLMVKSCRLSIVTRRSHSRTNPANKKGRGETAPTFLIIAYLLVPVHPWTKASSSAAIASGELISVLISNADCGCVFGDCVQKKFAAVPLLVASPICKQGSRAVASEFGNRRRRLSSSRNGRPAEMAGKTAMSRRPGSHLEPSACCYELSAIRCRRSGRNPYQPWKA